jgi:alpha-L-arabinofuranosidase
MPAPRPLFLAALLLALIGGAPVAAAPAEPPAAVQIRVQPDAEGRPARPELLGSNTPWVYGSEGLVDAQGRWHSTVMQRVRDWSPPVLRYPGGEPADSYPWRAGIGPLAQRPEIPVYAGQPPQRIVFGSLEFLETCEALGARPLIVLNLHGGSDAEVARDAADWLRWANGTPRTSRQTGQALPKVLDWELGNEPYLMDARLASGQPNPKFLRPDQFARRVNAVMAAMRAVDPAVRLGLPMALDTLSGRPWQPHGEPATVVGDQLGYAQRVLDGLDRPQDLAFLALHYYMPLLGDAERLVRERRTLPSDDALFAAAMAGPQTVQRHLDQLAAFWARQPRTARLPLPALWVTEYNAFFTSGQIDGREPAQNRYVASQGGALFVADLLRVLSQDARVSVATQWSLSGNWVFGAIDSPSSPAPVAVRPVFQVMHLARQWLSPGSRLLPTQVQGPSTTLSAAALGLAAAWPDMPLVTAQASRHGRQLQLWIINKSPRETLVARVDLGPGSETAARAVQLRSPAGVFSDGGAPVAVPAGPCAQNTQTCVTLAPASLTLLSLTLPRPPAP